MPSRLQFIRFLIEAYIDLSLLATAAHDASDIHHQKAMQGAHFLRRCFSNTLTSSERTTIRMLFPAALTSSKSLSSQPP
jgi:hypothetical protein